MIDRSFTAMWATVPRMVLITLAMAGLSSVAQATPLNVTDVFLQYFNDSSSLLYGSGGEMIRYGSDSVIPNGDAGTTGTATTTNLSTNNTVSRTVPFLPAPDDPNFFEGSFLISSNASSDRNPSNLTGPWTITFQNTTTTPTSVTNTISLAGPGEIPLVNNVTLSGTKTNPTFSWSPPTGVTVAGYRINIIQNSLPGNGTVVTKTFPPTMTSYTVQSSDFTVPGYSFNPDTQYTIGILALVTRDGSTTNLGNENVSASSEAFYSFEVQTSPPSQPIYLPITSINAMGDVQYGFNITVVPNVTYYIDPSVAIGYVYQTGDGNPNFASVELPDIGNSSPYDLYLWNGSAFIFDTTLAADTLFDFAPGGVSEFEVLGIDPQLGLDPTNTTAFVTALTFEGAGTFTGTMTPITTNVPEPASLLLFVSGLIGLGLTRRYRAEDKH